MIIKSKNPFTIAPSCDRCQRAGSTYFSTAAAIDAAVAAGWSFDGEGEGRLLCPDCSAVEQGTLIQDGMQNEAKTTWR